MSSSPDHLGSIAALEDDLKKRNREIAKLRDQVTVQKKYFRHHCTPRVSIL